MTVRITVLPPEVPRLTMIHLQTFPFFLLFPPVQQLYRSPDAAVMHVVRQDALLMHAAGRPVVPEAVLPKPVPVKHAAVKHALVIADVLEMPAPVMPALPMEDVAVMHVVVLYVVQMVDVYKMSVPVMPVVDTVYVAVIFVQLIPVPLMQYVVPMFAVLMDVPVMDYVLSMPVALMDALNSADARRLLSENNNYSINHIKNSYLPEPFRTGSCF